MTEKKCIEKYNWEQKTDTLFRTITISKDSLILIVDSITTTDTIIKENDRIKLKYWYKDKLVYIQGDCKEVVKKDTTIINRVEKKGFLITDEMQKYIMWGVIALVLFLIWLNYKYGKDKS